jgi:hypothetical protein
LVAAGGTGSVIISQSSTQWAIHRDFFGNPLAKFNLNVNSASTSATLTPVSGNTMNITYQLKQQNFSGNVYNTLTVNTCK